MDQKFMNDEPKKMPDKKLPDHRRKPPAPSGKGWMWRYAIWFFLLWIVFMYFFRSFNEPERTEIAYTEFKRQIKHDNIQKVLVKGKEVSGTFKSYYLVTQDGDTT
ncbi:MAG: hypothetical protein GWN62_10555, partial [Aliifodinibius sp.]|nr:hypothetical protein [Fodinibius sp.]